MTARDITLGMRVRVHATLIREVVIEDGSTLGGWRWVRLPVLGEPIIGIVAAIRTKNNGRMEDAGGWNETGYEYVAHSYMRAVLVYSTLYRNPVWALLDDVGEAGDGD